MSPPSFVCVGIIFDPFFLEISLCNSWFFCNFITRVGGEICLCDVNMQKGYFKTCRLVLGRLQKLSSRQKIIMFTQQFIKVTIEKNECFRCQGLKNCWLKQKLSVNFVDAAWRPRLKAVPLLVITDFFSSSAKLIRVHVSLFNRFHPTTRLPFCLKTDAFLRRLALDHFSILPPTNQCLIELLALPVLLSTPGGGYSILWTLRGGSARRGGGGLFKLHVY